MKKHIATLALSIIIVSVTIAQKPFHPKNMKHESIESYQTELNLTETQIDQINAVRAEYREESPSQNRGEMTPEKREEMKSKRSEEREKAHAILTDEQKTKFQEIKKAERQQRAAERSKAAPDTESIAD
ncbi:MAG TPA: hypothetical protein DCR48_06605 [Flavobacteriales bacterium]|nr:hypothetical protein [Flavobacteriales bacterium]